MYTCIHAYHTLHTYIYTYTHCSCMTIGHVTRCIIWFFLVGRQGSTLAIISMFMAATACQMHNGDKQGSTATADQLRRKTQPQLRTSVDARKANHRNCGELSATAHYFSLPASLASFHVAFLGTSAYIGGECCQREVGAIMLFSSAPPCRCVQSFSLTDKPIL